MGGATGRRVRGEGGGDDGGWVEGIVSGLVGEGGARREQGLGADFWEVEYGVDRCGGTWEGVSVCMRAPAQASRRSI